MIGLLPLVSREITRSYIDKEVSTQASQSIASESSSQNSIEKPQVNSADKAVSPTVKTEIKTIKEEAFSWDEFDASPERAKLGDDVIRMQNNNLKGAHFLPVNYGKSNLEKFMRENNLKFTMASLDCFSSDTHCSLTIAITRSKYPSKANGDFCGPMARWTAPYKDLNAWETDLRSPLDQLLFQGNAQGVLNKIDYEYERRCS
ncbi:hypothetical protein NI401_07085 [Acinetobacter indicus]|uniref:hypothetical protein n=1 Tax=Acinetobacter indicus TaxID=756892 RepID=UPI00209AF706|nr:hypothetical protein [Acinetobacter indicus]MCO8102675.1 hypothetical protein [Acinetobacter indicus]